MTTFVVHRSMAVAIVAAGLTTATSRDARAIDPPEATATAVGRAVEPSPPPPPGPYSLPWQLRPAAASTVFRVDSSVAFYDANGNSGTTAATMLLGSYAVTPHLAPVLRLGVVQNQAPGAAPDGTSFINPVVGLTYARHTPAVRWALFAGATVPIGTGSGDQPDAATSAANTAGLQARSGMDNAMFAVNYFTGILGADLAYVGHRATLQVEATLFQLFRVRGDEAGAQSTDAARTNSTMGIHAGYFLLPILSLGAELRYQRWLTTPTRLVMGNKVDIPDANKDTMTVALGPRVHFKIGRTMVVRPGVSYSRALDNPLSGASYNTLQIDVPVLF